MALTKKTYNFYDLEEQDYSSVPSLDLPSIVEDGWFKPADGGKYMLILAHMDEDYRPASGCPYCGTGTKLIRSGTGETKIIHDVMRNNYRVDIAYQPSRLQCTTCKQRFTPDVEGIVPGRQMTERLYDYLKVESFIQPMNVLAERTGYSEIQIGQILDEQIDRFDDERLQSPIEAPHVLGIDEKHLGHKMRGTLVDVRRGKLLDMLEDNEQKTMENAIRQLKDWDTNIKVVTTDMANQYIKWLRVLLPNATIVIDKYHVIQDIERKITTTKKVLYQYRKKLIEGIEDVSEKNRQLAVLRIVNNNKRLFNFSMERIMREADTGKPEKLSTVIDEFPEFRLLHNLHYTIEYMYTKLTRAEAEEVWAEWEDLLPPDNAKKYREWCDLYSVDEECFDAFRSFQRRGFQQYEEYILNYFNPGCRETNAVTEGLNSLIENINMAGKGYSFKRLRGKALYASLIHQRITYGIDVKSIPKWKPGVIKFQSYFTSDWFKMGGDSSFSGVQNEDVECFTSNIEPFQLPEISLFGDNSWLYSIFSADFVHTVNDEYADIRNLIDERLQKWRPRNSELPCQINEPNILEGAEEWFVANGEEVYDEDGFDDDEE